jgi:7-cyano-7-deazaguanine reductase
MSDLKNAPLGKTTSYTDIYDPSLLFPIPRQMQRQGRGITGDLPFKGDDVWYAYELSWLNSRGKPEVAIGKFTVPCDSPCLIESKSFKLYLNSFTGTKFSSLAEVRNTIIQDASAATQALVQFDIKLLSELSADAQLGHFPGVCLDSLDIDCDTYTVFPQYLQCLSDKVVTEVLCSNLLKSNCLKTGQPDWGSLQITYTGKEIDKEGLLRYIVSLRNHSGFAEDCIEQIYIDILQQCAPQELTIDGRITRRGGLDINPLRSNARVVPERYAARLWRQ